VVFLCANYIDFCGFSPSPLFETVRERHSQPSLRYRAAHDLGSPFSSAPRREALFFCFETRHLRLPFFLSTFFFCVARPPFSLFRGSFSFLARSGARVCRVLIFPVFFLGIRAAWMVRLLMLDGFFSCACRVSPVDSAVPKTLLVRRLLLVQLFAAPGRFLLSPLS